MRTDVVAPWQAPLTGAEHSLIVFGLAVAGFALLAMLVRTWTMRDEVSGRYRPAVSASLGAITVATISYVALVVHFTGAYRLVGGVWTPGPDAIWAWGVRYLDWAVSVPLLVVELVAVSSLRGKAIARTRNLGVAGAFLMIATGYIGGVVVDEGRSFPALLTWGIISSLFFAGLYVLILLTVLRSLPALPSVARPSYRAAMVLLMVTWFVYPIVFGLQGLTSGGAWAATSQLLLSAADVAAKVGFGLLIFRVAKLRTVFDVLTGIDVHRETLWVDGLRQSDALLPTAQGADPASLHVDLAAHHSPPVREP